MDKAEYKIKLEQINACAEKGDFRGAAQTADTIDWRRVKSARTLCMVSEIYEANKRYEDGMEILRYAYRRAPQSKTVLYRLAETSLRAGNVEEAQKYYAEFEQIAPYDTSRYVLRYKLLRAQKAPLDEQIAVLKEYKEREYTEKWAYELAKLYKKNGQKQRCIEECDDMILWFAEGRYVTRAMELKMQLQPLSESQKAKYESRLAAAREAAEREAMLREEEEAQAETEELAEEPDEDITADSADAAQGAEEVPSSVSTAEVIEKMNAAADASLQGARSQDRRPNVTPAARPSIAGRAAAGNDMQDQLASSIRAVFSGLRPQSEEQRWEKPSKEAVLKNMRQSDDAEVPADATDLDLAQIFAETEQSIAKNVKAATSDGKKEEAQESASAGEIRENEDLRKDGGKAENPQAEDQVKESPQAEDQSKDSLHAENQPEEGLQAETEPEVGPQAEALSKAGKPESDAGAQGAEDLADHVNNDRRSEELAEDDADSDDDADENVNVSFVEKNGVIEIVTTKEDTAAPAKIENTSTGETAAAEPESHEMAEAETDELTGRETDESLGITREFNFGRELSGIDVDGGARTSAAGRGAASAGARTGAMGRDTASVGLRGAENRIPNPEEAASRIVAEAAREQGGAEECGEEENPAGYENIADLSDRLFQGVTEVPAQGFASMAEVPARNFAKENEVPAEETAAAESEAGTAVAAAAGAARISIIDHLLDEPDLIDRMDVTPRNLDDTEKKLFSYFSSIPGIGEQVSVAIADIHNNSGDRTSKSGNVLIVGRRGCGKTKLADSLVLAVCKDLNITAAKTAKIIASDFNQKDAAAIVKKMAGGFLIIEGAGELAADTVDKLNRAMEFRTDDMVVILEDEKQDMKDMLDRYPEFAAKFTSKITIPVFTNDELVTFGKTYAQECGYSFDEMATLALYTMIGENQKNAEPVTVGMVRDMIDKAIAKSKSKKFPLFGKTQVGADGRIVLREKDFAF